MPRAARARAPGTATSTRAPPWPRPSSRRPATPPWRRRSSPTIEPPLGHQRQEGVDQRLERVGRDVAARPPRRPTRPPGSRRRGTPAGAKPMACSTPSTRSHCGGHVVAHGGDVLGVGHVELEHRRRRRQLAGRALGERQPPAGAGQHDLGALRLGQLGHAEGQRGVGEDAGDDDPLAVEEPHGASTLSSGHPCHALSPCRSASSAARGRRVRRSASGWRRSASTSCSARARRSGPSEVVADLHGPLARPGAAPRRRQQRGRRRRRPRRDRHAVGLGGHHGPDLRRPAWPARSW